MCLSIFSYFLYALVRTYIFFCVSSTQWGRKLDGWPNTAARLAGWRKVTRLVWICTWWTGHTARLFLTVPVALTEAAQLRADWIPSCCFRVNVHNHPSWATSSKKGMVWYSSSPMPYLFSSSNTAQSSFVFSIVLQYVKAAVLLFSLLTYLFSIFLFSSYKDMRTVSSNAHININYFYANNPMTPYVSTLY